MLINLFACQDQYDFKIWKTVSEKTLFIKQVEILKKMKNKYYKKF